MKGQQDYEIDIKNNKVKQGFLIKRSRILKQWKQRWMVLTKTHLYSFIQKQVYKDPTQKIPLKQVSTIKSYYKNQYARPQVIRVQSDDTDFYLSAKNHQEKWSWMTSIQKMTSMLIGPAEQSVDTQNLIRQTIRMSSAIRKTITIKSQKKQQSMMNSDIPKDLFKKLNIIVNSNTVQATIYPTLNKIKQVPQQQYRSSQSSAKRQKPAIFKNNEEQAYKQHQVMKKQQQTKIQVQKSVQKSVQEPQIKQKIVQKIVYVPQIKQKIVYVPQIKQKIVYVPQIKQVIKTVYINKIQNQQSISSTTQYSNILQFFTHVMQLKCQVIYLFDLYFLESQTFNIIYGISYLF